MSDIQHIGGRTPDLTEENVDKLVALFPDVLTEVTDQQTGKAESGDYDDDGGQLVVNPESNGRFHSDWCSMIYPRLLLARDLLASDGVIFISIDENESANLKKICDEVFGNECFVNKVIWRSSDNSNNDAKQFSNDYNDILIYSKKPGWQPNRLQDPEKRRHFKNPDNDPRGAWFDGVLLTRLIIGKIFDMKLWHPMAILLSLRQMDGVGAKRLLIRKRRAEKYTSTRSKLISKGVHISRTTRSSSSPR